MTKAKNRSRATKEEAAVIIKPDISNYVTNPEGNIYAISNLTEEFIAVLFAWVSRSPKSFKEHLIKAIEDGLIPQTDLPSFEKLSEKASAFHQKWVVNYGHSSVSEHATAHVGIEKISRLASAELELSNEFYSITEYSQRYQKPVRGDWHNPFDPETMDHANYESFMHECFDLYEKLCQAVLDHLVSQEDFTGVSDRDRKIRMEALEKLAFEDARYALPLGMHTMLGMSANGRAWRDGVSKLLTSRYEEVVNMAMDLKMEISKVLPTLLRHANLSHYESMRNNHLKDRFKDQIKVGQNIPVQLLDYPHEVLTIKTIIAQAMMEHMPITYSEALYRAADMTPEERLEIIRELLWGMQSHDVPPDSFKQVHIQFALLVSEASWHQLLRHNRKTNFTFNQPCPYFGVTIPPRVVQAGLEKELLYLAHRAEELFMHFPEGKREFVVLNAHRRHIVADFSLWEAYHLINLRTSEHAQWDIQDTFEQIWKSLRTVMPNLIAEAKRK